ncbi:hypothetical protein GDO86_020553 [Hymenochirus boettgeri]|uniref:Heart- and neural crest derivatives-expressed protein 2 n=1 Tax=Hymenochirus boettgeri TaxID=247094 RepID=A0A8T2IDZ6_9PIPI|nr:hypothetical protein GDO86_020553 [Hymenochirus boettgeri]
MSLVGGFPHHPVVHHEGYPFAALQPVDATKRTLTFTAGISHPEMSPPITAWHRPTARSTPMERPGWTTPIKGCPREGTGSLMQRPVKRRGTANRKERRRTQSINSAFAELRECIPIYIAYLMDLLAKDDQNGETEAFKAEIKRQMSRREKEEEMNELLKTTVCSNDKKTKGRTGWPQHVWALELKQ